MEWPRLGYVSYINCLPVFCAMEEGLVKVPARLCAHHPCQLNSMFRKGQLEVTAVSSIEYARHPKNCLVLPDLSIAADGPVRSVAMVSRLPVEQLAGGRVSLTPHSATSVVLLKLLMHRFYKIQADFFIRPEGTNVWWEEPDASLVIGDEALLEISRGSSLYTYDLADEWKRWTGRPMVFALWVTTSQFAGMYPEQLTSIWQGMLTSKKWGQKNPDKLLARAGDVTELPGAVLEDYFNCLQHDLTWHHIDSLMYFYNCAAECGLVQPAVALNIWGKENDRCYRVQSA